MRDVALWLVRHEHLHHHLAGLHFARLVSCDNHALGRFANTRRSQSTLALDCNHTSAAVTVGPIARLWLVAQMRDHKAATIGDLPDGHAFFSFDRFTIKCECNF